MVPLFRNVSVHCNVPACNAQFGVEAMQRESDEDAIKHTTDHAVSEGWRRVGIGVRCPSCVARFGVGRVRR